MSLAATRLGSLVDEHHDEILSLVRQHKGRTVAVFGSVARGEDGPASDVDLLVEFEPGTSLFDVIRLEDALADLLGCRVDVLSASPLLDDDDPIRRDLVAL